MRESRAMEQKYLCVIQATEAHALAARGTVAKANLCWCEEVVTTTGSVYPCVPTIETFLSVATSGIGGAEHDDPASA